MVLASTITLLKLDFLVYVHRTLMVIYVNMIIDHVNQIHAGIAVNLLRSLKYSKHPFSFLMMLGTCEIVENITFVCHCQLGWEGKRCQRQINNCTNVECLNHGVCRPLLMNYTCECLGDSYSGRHCETLSMKIKIHKFISKSFAFVGILALIFVAMFIVIMDILKYCFGIDPVHEERERIRRKKQERNRKPVIQRFHYFDTPQTSDHCPNIDTKETMGI